MRVGESAMGQCSKPDSVNPGRLRVAGIDTHRIDSHDRRRPSARDRPPRARPPALLRNERTQPASR